MAGAGWAVCVCVCVCARSARAEVERDVGLRETTTKNARPRTPASPDETCPPRPLSLPTLRRRLPPEHHGASPPPESLIACLCAPTTRLACV